MHDVENIARVMLRMMQDGAVIGITGSNHKISNKERNEKEEERRRKKERRKKALTESTKTPTEEHRTIARSFALVSAFIVLLIIFSSVLRTKGKLLMLPAII